MTREQKEREEAKRMAMVIERRNQQRQALLRISGTGCLPRARACQC